MKHICRYNLFLALFMIFVLGPVSSDASFLVEFHNGRRVKVEAYQVKGKSYEFYLDSGILRVSKEEIKSIQEKKDDAVRRPQEETGMDRPVTPGDLKEQGASKNSVNTVPQGTAVESTLKTKAELRERWEEAKKVYFAATEKTEKDWARQKMTSFSRELYSLEAEVKEKHKGSLPDWWKEN